jgi:UDP-glucose 4-epimerase
MKVTLTGATGRLGSHVCRVLSERGHSVTATDVSFRADLPVRIEVANLLDGTSCYHLLEGADAVVHLANYPGVVGNNGARTLNENTAMNMNIFEAARQLGVKKIIYASSIQAIIGRRPQGAAITFSNLPYLPLDSAVPLNPGNAYALSKAVAEQMLAYFAKQDGMSCIAIRFPLLADPEGLRWWRPSMRDHFPGHINPDEAGAYLPYTEAATLIDAILRANLPGFRVYQPAAADHMVMLPVADIVQKLYPKMPLHKPLSEMTSLVDISQIERETGWKPSAPAPVTTVAAASPS